MTPKATTEHRWGVVYSGVADLEIAAGAVEAASTDAGMRCERRSIVAGGLAIHAVQTRPWYRVLLAAAPQRLEWRLEPSGREVSISVDFRLFPWYAVAVLFFGLLIAGSLVAGLMSVGHDLPPELRWLPPALQGLFFAALLLSIVPVILLGALGGGRQVQAIWQPILRRVENAGGRLEPRGRTVSRRYLVAMSIYTGTFLLAVGLPLLEALTGPTALFVALLLILLLAVVRMSGQAAYMLRSEALLGGLLSVSCAVVYLGLPLMTVPLAAVGEELLTGAAELQMRHDDGSISTEEALELASLRRFVRGLMISSAVVVTLLFGGLLLYGARLTLSAWVTVWRLQEQRDQGVWSEAVRDPSLLLRFRRGFVTLWGVSAVLVFGALGFNGLCVLQSVMPFSARPEIRLVELSEGALALALDRSLGDSAVMTAAHAGWWLYALSGPALLALSAGQLARARRRELRALRRVAAHAQPQRTLDRLTATAGTPRVFLSVPEASRAYASSVVFGLWRPERFIVVSSRCLEALKNEDDLEAVIAHELAHHLEGHCRRDQLLRWLGRLTLVGDAFALLMQNSWGYEEAADRAAIEKLGVRGENLLRSLQIMRQSRALESLPPPPPGLFSGLSALPSRRVEIENLLEKGPSALSLRKRWSLAWQVLREQYFDAISLYYWHPTDRLREQTLRSL